MTAGLHVYADESTAPGPVLTKEVGRPFTVQFDDDHVVGFKLYQDFASLETTFTLAENSCTPQVGTKLRYVIPVVRRALIPIWTKHPTLQGTPVMIIDEDESPLPKVDLATVLATRVNRPKTFAWYLRTA